MMASLYLGSNTRERAGKKTFISPEFTVAFEIGLDLETHRIEESKIQQ
jgi:hypothetical protein